MNTFDQMRQAVYEARTTLNAADSIANDLAELLRDRLRKVSPYRLAALKRELQTFDAHKKQWKA